MVVLCNKNIFDTFFIKYEFMFMEWKKHVILNNNKMGIIHKII